jgi:ABC-type transport system involved in multi-copper enzyme maturation permease subunit
MIARQIQAVIRLELKKTFFSRRGIWVYLVAFLPCAMFLAHAIDVMNSRNYTRETAAQHPLATEALQSIHSGMTAEEVESKLGPPISRRIFNRRGHSRLWLSYTDGSITKTFSFEDGELRGIETHDTGNFQEDAVIFATVFQFFYLRLAIFFGCVGIFLNLFRGEMIDKSLHFYLLAPIRREVLVAGKYLAGLIATVVIFSTSTALQLWFLALPRADASNLHVAQYMGVTALACMGYGSVFLAAGLLFKNPMLTAAVVLLWEAANIFLPTALKKISIIFYLQSLCPVVAPPEQQSNPILALLVSSAEATPAPVAILGLIAVTALILAYAAIRSRKLEINYSSD